MGTTTSKMILPEHFCENKEDISKDPVMNAIVREIINIYLDTKKFYNGLAKSLSMAKAKNYRINRLLSKVASRSPTLSEDKMNKVKKELMDFAHNKYPFKDLLQEYEPLLQRYEQLYSNLEEKIKELSGKRKTARVWYIGLETLLSLVKVAVAITCFVVTLTVVTPLTVFTVTNALQLFEKLLAILGPKMLYPIQKEKNRLDEAEQLAEKIKKDITATRSKLKEITDSVENLSRYREPIVFHVKSHVEDPDLYDLADIAMPIKELGEQLLKKLAGLEKEVDGCVEKLTEQIGDLKKAFPLMCAGFVHCKNGDNKHSFGVDHKQNGEKNHIAQRLQQQNTSVVGKEHLGKATLAHLNLREPPIILGFPTNCKVLTLENWLWQKLPGQQLYMHGYVVHRQRRYRHC